MEAFTSQLNAQLQDSQQKIEGLELSIANLNSKISNSRNRNIDSKTRNWTNIYEYCRDFEDIEDLQFSKDNEQEKLKELKDSQTFLGHTHDHDDERQIYLLPDHEKIALCEQYRASGNFLYYEGFYVKAIEMYKIALSYYEYCFPENKSSQDHLDDLRHVTLCNIASCFIKMKEFRHAIESIDQVLRESGSLHAKALFRRGIAFRELFDFERATLDFTMALEHDPENLLIKTELRNLLAMSSASYEIEKEVYKRALGMNSSLERENKTSTPLILSESSVFDNLLFRNEMPIEPGIIL